MNKFITIGLLTAIFISLSEKPFLGTISGRCFKPAEKSNLSDNDSENIQNRFIFFHKFHSDNERIISEIIEKQFKLKKNIVLSIPSPEIVRYSLLQDKMETLALEVFYENFGKNYANFSVGCFQMKPSFCEEIEQFIVTNNNFSCYEGLIEIKGKDAIEIRKKRIERLRNVEWQLKYLSLFYLICEAKYQHINFNSLEDKIKWYATTYNVGIQSSDEKIKRWFEIPMFSYASGFNETKCFYWKQAIEFYKEMNRKK
jgi:hypothetical protein